MPQHQAQGVVEERAVELIAARVTVALREDIEALLAAFSPPRNEACPPTLTVDQLAARLGVGRSTVYAHWREWGGYKLGTGPKAPIRFNPNELPSPRDDAANWPASQTRPPKGTARRRRGGRELIQDAPRLTGLEQLLGGHA